MRLVYQALEKQPVPMSLPSNLIPPSKRRKASVLAGAIPVLPGAGVAIGAGSGRSSPTTGSLASPVRKASVNTITYIKLVYSCKHPIWYRQSVLECINYLNAF